MYFSFDFGWYYIYLILSNTNMGGGEYLLNEQNPLSATKAICRQPLNLCLKLYDGNLGDMLI